MSSPTRFEAWPWRDFGHFGMTRRQATLEASYARTVAEQVRLPGRSEPWPVSEWVPWAKCSAAEFAAAGVGVP
jgi:hypothetical protein